MYSLCIENPWWKLEIPFHRISCNLGQLKYIYYSNYLMFSTIIQQNKNNNEEILKKTSNHRCDLI